jgi:hypothetical protein
MFHQNATASALFERTEVSSWTRKVGEVMGRVAEAVSVILMAGLVPAFIAATVFFVAKF